MRDAGREARSLVSKSWALNVCVNCASVSAGGWSWRRSWWLSSGGFPGTTSRWATWAKCCAAAAGSHCRWSERGHTRTHTSPEPLATVVWSCHFVSCVCLQRGSNYGSLMTGDGNLQVFAKTGYYKVSVLLVFFSDDNKSDWCWKTRPVTADIFFWITVFCLLAVPQLCPAYIHFLKAFFFF